MSSRDPYAVLGLAPNVDDVVIRAAWKALLRKYHPDTSSEPGAAARTIEINSAFTQIGKPEARAAFERARATRNAPPPPPPRRPQPAWRPAPMPARPPMSPRKRLGFSVAAAIIIVVTPSLLIARRMHLFTFPSPIEWTITKARSIESLDDFRTRLRIRLGLETPLPPPSAAPAEQAERPVPRLDSETTVAAVQSFEEILSKGGFTTAVAVSKQCASEASAHPSWTLADRCLAFDVAGEAAAGAMGEGAAGRYFTAASTNAPSRYFALTNDGNAVGERIALIRDGIWPMMIDRIAARVHAAADNAPKGPPLTAPQ